MATAGIYKNIIFFLALLLPLLLSLGCRNQEAGGAPPPPMVEVTDTIVRDVPIYAEWTGSTDGLVNTTIRAQVQGYLISRDYNEGEFVKKGQVLFRIDPRPFQTALQQAKGISDEQRARWRNARANLERTKPLVAEDAISKKDLDDAIGAEDSSRSAMVAAQATVDKAALDLSFTKITSPISGIAGIARAQIGNLAKAGFPSSYISPSVLARGKVRLTGVVQVPWEKSAAERIVREVEGVDSVEDNIEIASR